MPNRDYHQERRDYEFAELNRSALNSNPFAQFSAWMDQAVQQKIMDPTAMSVSTVSANGQPHSRVVLLKAFAEDGFVFYSHYDSAKGMQIETNNQVALLFFWPEMDRQIRIEGTISKIPLEQSEHYFQSRPRDSQLSAYISQQSKAVKNRAELEGNLANATEDFAGEDIPHPPHWGGYKVTPTLFEFWQGRPSRLHDRFQFSQPKNQQAWTIERLAP
ncbi:MAG: pyridoxamine 5'-phosphate oxidase [Thiotrichales bacterium]|nr:pyridoxamine 5'-phosphate oxidase [Thiotrichales bacterium]